MYELIDDNGSDTLINSIKHAFRVLECFTKESPELGVTDISEKLGMSVSTVHHIVTTLYQEGILVKTQSRRYRLGSKLISWGELVSEQYKPYFMTIPYIETLIKRVNETVYLTIIENDEVSYLAKIETFKPIRIETNIGSRKPLHSTGAGKAMLAFQNQKMIKRIINNGSESDGSDQILDSQSLLDELQIIRRRGYAMNNGELRNHYLSVAVPIKNYMGNVIGALSVEGPKEQMKNNHDAIVQHLLNTTSTISKHCDFETY